MAPKTANAASRIQLTPTQKEAVSYLQGPLLIIAGPGSGKTEVISSRAAHLISSGQARPQNLLVTTFTEKAALELKDRIQSKLPNINVELMQVSTIHSFCYTLLQEFRSASPFPRGFWVLDEAAQLLFIYSHRKELGLSQIMKGRESDFYSSVLQTFNHATEELVDPDQYISACSRALEKASDEDQADCEEKLQVARAYKKYLALLLDSNATDFSNLQRHTLEMLNRHPDILQQIQKRYTEVLIDEYQDTNMVQELILGKIAEPHMHYTVVGDDDQSIYRFRGATVKNILGFCEKYRKKCSALKTVKLEDNFRSLAPIINHSGRLIRYNQKRSPKNLCCHRRDYKNDILYIHEETAAQEAQAVVSVLNKLLHNGTINRYGDIALLLRSVRSYAQPYLEALTEEKIPYIVTRDGYFFNRKDISELYNLFLFLGASKAWGDKFVRCSLLSLKKETEAALKKYKKDLTALDSPEKLKNIGVTDPHDREKLSQLIGLKKRVQARKNESILEVLYDLFPISGYFQKVVSEGNEEALKNLGILTNMVREFDEYRGTRVLYPFLSYMKLLRQSGLDSFRQPPEDAVQVMTVHQAKGLEFPVVVIGAAMEGRFPSRHRRSQYEIPTHLRESGKPEVENPHIDDERKLFYVASSRARDILIIGSSEVVNKRGGGRSRFIEELLGGSMDRALQRSQEVLESPLKVKAPEAKTQGPRMRINYSQLVYFLQCPLRYKYFVIDGISPPGSEYFYFGASVHRALELIHNDALRRKSIKEEDVPSYVEKTWLMPQRIKGEKEKNQKEAAINQIKTYIRNHHPTFSYLFKAEENFAFDWEGAVVTGKIDLIRKESSAAKELIDFKTIASPQKDKEQSELQMDVYALGAEKGLNLQVGKRSLHFLKDDQVTTCSWDNSKREKIQNCLTRWIQKIQNEDFEPRPEYCPYCEEFKEICPYYQNKNKRNEP